MLLQEIDFVASDLSLEIIGDFAIVWLLSPRKSFRPLPKSVLGRVYKALPGHALQAGYLKAFILDITTGVLLILGPSATLCDHISCY